MISEHLIKEVVVLSNPEMEQMVRAWFTRQHPYCNASLLSWASMGGAIAAFIVFNIYNATMVVLMEISSPNAIAVVAKSTLE